MFQSPLDTQSTMNTTQFLTADRCGSFSARHQDQPSYCRLPCGAIARVPGARAASYSAASLSQSVSLSSTFWRNCELSFVGGAWFGLVGNRIVKVVPWPLSFCA